MAFRQSYAGQFPQGRIYDGQVFRWQVQGSGGAAPTPRYRQYPRWQFLQFAFTPIYVWSCTGSGGAVPVSSTRHDSYMKSLHKMMNR